MTLWRLEWLRLTRTRRLFAVVSVYVFFGLTGPLSARYLSQILNRFGTSGIKIEIPPPKPADGIAQFASNASQIGLLVVLMVAGSALAFDARTEMAVFLRTRVAVRDIILAAYTMSGVAAIGALLAGTLAAWYETSILLGALPVGRMLLGIALGALFLAFVVALAALVASLVKGTLATVGVSLGGLLLLALLGNFDQIGRWLPTTLSGANAALVAGASPGDYTWAAVTTVVVTVAALAAATALSARREL
jgi:ABC-2 type transport system permease protein